MASKCGLPDRQDAALLSRKLVLPGQPHQLAGVADRAVVIGQCQQQVTDLAMPGPEHLGEFLYTSHAWYSSFAREPGRLSIPAPRDGNQGPWSRAGGLLSCVRLAARTFPLFILQY